MGTRLWNCAKNWSIYTKEPTPPARSQHDCLSLLCPLAESSAFSPDVPLYFPPITHTSVPGRVQGCVAFFPTAHLKARWFELHPNLQASDCPLLQPGAAGGDSGRTPRPLAAQSGVCSRRCFPTRLDPGRDWCCLTPGAAPIPEPAGICFISLAADEKPWPQDVFVHILLGKARGGAGAEEGGSQVTLWILKFIFNTFFFFPPKELKLFLFSSDALGVLFCLLQQ